MNKVTSTEFLTPSAKLVDEVADWLCGREPSEGRRGYTGRVRDDPSGTKSLAHVCVVVPTAQSCRNLRLAFAQRFPGRGLLPPRIVQPMELVVPAETAANAISGVRAAAAFLAFVRDREATGKSLSDSWPHLFRTEPAADVRFLLGFFDQLEELWTLLGSGGLLMRDVPANEKAVQCLADAGDDESNRWEDLANVETAFFAFLHELGLRHRAEAIRSARTAPPPLPDGIEEVVLPALADPVPVLCDVLEKAEGAKLTVLFHADPADKDRFDQWGRPKPECWTGENQPKLPLLRNEDIVCSATDADMARRLAKEFKETPAGAALPALGLCDDDLFQELSGAFLAAGFDLHDPEKRNLSESTLGRVLSTLLDLRAARDAGRPLPWAAFARLVREDDVLLALAPDPARRAEVLAGLDVCRNAFLPMIIPDGVAFDEERVRFHDRPVFRSFREAARRLLDLLEHADADRPATPEFLLRTLRALFAGRRLRENEGAREFRAAAEAARQALGLFDGGGLDDAGLTDEDRTALVRKALASAAYSRETPRSRADGTETAAVKTAGWLELPWSDAGNVALAGFHEGAVPQTSTGHLFLPDKLRDALGLPTNARRLARDTFLLSELLASRSEKPGPGSVRAYVARTNDAGDVHRPSRLLFLVPDADLPGRVKALFGDLPAAAAKPAREIAPGWRPRLPFEVPLPSRDEKTPEGRLSASAINAWIGCPFSYLFSVGMGMDRAKEKEELGYDDFGTIVHAVLEDYANEQIERRKRGLSDLTDEKQIREFLCDAAKKRGQAFGAHPSTRVALQLDAVMDRLLAFAKIQAAWARDGWFVHAAEKDFLVRPFEGEGVADVWVKGSVDRIDYKEGVGYRLIDYKTWDDKNTAPGHVLSRGKLQAELAEKLGLPVVPAPTKKDGTPKKNASAQRILSVQLPLYARCLEKADPTEFGGRIADLCYLVLGKDEANTCVFGSAFNQGSFECQPRKFDKDGNPKPGRIELIGPEFFDLALDTARRAISGIRANLFWPPGPGSKYDLDALFLKSPASDLEGTPWLAEQERRLTAFAGEKGSCA